LRRQIAKFQIGGEFDKAFEYRVHILWP
jgi:hypothetical protein